MERGCLISTLAVGGFYIGQRSGASSWREMSKCGLAKFNGGGNRTPGLNRVMGLAARYCLGWVQAQL